MLALELLRSLHNDIVPNSQVLAPSIQVVALRVVDALPHYSGHRRDSRDDVLYLRLCVVDRRNRGHTCPVQTRLYVSLSLLWREPSPGTAS